MTSLALTPQAPPRRIHIWMAVALMLCSLGLTQLLRPTRYWSDVTGRPNLDRIVPAHFGDWGQSPYGANVVVNPQQQEALNAIYDSTLNRVYVHKPSGRVFMLSLAYGRDQSTATALHPPEDCYRSQGFRVDTPVNAMVSTSFGTINAKRMQAAMGLRHEPVTYFMRVGDKLARGSIERNLVRLAYAGKGYLVDGLLFRVSEITDRTDSFDLQDDFVRSLLKTVSADDRKALIGAMGS